MKGFVERMKKSKVMGKLMRSVSSKSSKLMNSLTPSTQKKATSKPAKLTISSATQQKLVVTTTNSVSKFSFHFYSNYLSNMFQTIGFSR